MTAPPVVRAAPSRSTAIATVPNALSLLRLVLVGIALGILFASNERIAASVVLYVAGMTDFLDGYVARRFDQVSELGKVLDPTVDRIVLGASAIAIVVYGAVPVWLAVIVLGREALVGIAVLVLAALGAARVEVIFVGKAGAFGLMTALPAFLLSDGAGEWAHDLRIAANVGIAISLVLAFVALLAYAPRARAALRARRADH